MFGLSGSKAPIGYAPRLMKTYSPDYPPIAPSEYDDEFDDGILKGWTVGHAYDDIFALVQTSNAAHISESLYPGKLAIQGAVGGSFDFYKPFTPDVTQPFTIALKLSSGFSVNVGNTENQTGIYIRGQADNVYYQVRVGKNNTNQAFRTIYANAGGAAEGMSSTNAPPVWPVYILISHNGSKSFSSFISGDGLSWAVLQLNLSISNLSSFTRLGLFATPVSGQPNGISVFDFVRYFPVAGKIKIGRTVP